MSEDRSSGRDEPHQRSGWLHDLLRSIGLMPPDEGAGTGEDGREAPPHAKVMIRNLMRIGELRVGDVMVPRADIMGVEASSSLDATVKAFRDAGHSRLPVYRGTLDEVIGMLHVKDLLPHWGGNGDFAIPLVARPVLFVPPSMRVLDLLGEMQTSRLHMALVIDEYGGVDGLVTLEDLVETVIGEIEDEHDEDEGALWKEEKPGVILAQSTAPLEEIEAALGLPLRMGEEDEEIDTLGGLVFLRSGRVPARGEVIEHESGVQFEIVDADPRRIKRVRVHLPAAAAARAPAAG